MPSPELLTEMLREVERHVEHQLHTIEELDDKTEQLITLAVATLGGTLALVAYVRDRFKTLGTDVSAGALGVAVVFALAGTLAFIHSYSGFRKRLLLVGPDPAWVREKANELDWSYEEHLMTVVRSYDSYARGNARVVRSIEVWRRTGLVMLVSSVALTLLASLFIVRGA